MSGLMFVHRAGEQEDAPVGYAAYDAAGIENYGASHDGDSMKEGRLDAVEGWEERGM